MNAREACRMVVERVSLFSRAVKENSQNAGRSEFPSLSGHLALRA